MSWLKITNDKKAYFVIRNETLTFRWDITDMGRHAYIIMIFADAPEGTNDINLINYVVMVSYDLNNPSWAMRHPYF